jgi:hypothetical protein
MERPADEVTLPRRNATPGAAAHRRGPQAGATSDTRAKASGPPPPSQDGDPLMVFTPGGAAP